MPSTHERAFLQAIIENPDDDAPRLVYADWLEEHGNVERAEFIRVQVECARLPMKDDRRRILERREQELLKEHEEAWTAGLQPLLFDKPLPSDGFHEPLLTQPWYFERGFIERVALRIDTFLERGADLFQLAPVRWMWFAFNQEEGEDVYGTEHARLATCTYLARLTTLDLSGHHFDSPIFGTNQLLRSSHLTALKRLYLRYGFGLDDVGFVDPSTVRLLASRKYLPSLRLLDLSLNEHGDDYAKALLRAKGFRHLESLSLRGVYLSGEGAEVLARATCLTNLRTLDLSLNDIGDRGARALARSPCLGKLARLVISRGAVTQEPEDIMTEDGSRALQERFGAALSFDT